ncbi:hypothetical protein IEO21_09803 [Rhodonia placenta]|uniref:Uncharacterized protein n=1 Tax=Rhodonia placenta TaxID=104341 RepID=A0A8H7TXK0_9APHY|nr:hypothetical protein IEO21_09803 [Postia placenta]
MHSTPRSKSMSPTMTPRATDPEPHFSFVIGNHALIAPRSHGALASINAAIGKGDFPDSCFGCGKQGYRHFECPNCKDKSYTKRADARATVVSGSTQVATSAPVPSPSASISAASAKSEQSELADSMAQVKSMREELEHYRAMKEEGF